MCGIAGIVLPQAISAASQPSTQPPVLDQFNGAPHTAKYRAALERMVTALRHRGPDGRGILEYSNCLLGHARLSIIDLSLGRQPMTSMANATPVSVTFNGEIYGFQELRKSLSEYSFQTACDTEVLLALYARHGNRMTRHLPGMFAFAMWDERKQTLFAARDRFGEKPFYYAWSEDGAFLFASEIKALLASGLIEPRVDRGALTHYFRHAHVHPHHTIYANVHALPPAHQFVLNRASLEKRRVEIEPYWTLPKENSAIGTTEAIEEWARLFERAVAKQMVSDVPLGVFLSGGLDSSAVAVAAARTQRASGHAKPMTLAFGFTLAGVNELPFARDVAQMHDTQHIEVVDEHLQIDVAEMIAAMSHIYDQPFGDASNIPMYLLCRETRRFCTVALSGDGGDELLSGYNWLYEPLFDMAHTPRWAASTHLAERAIGAAWHRAAKLRGAELPASWWRWQRGASLRRQHQTLLHAHRRMTSRFSDDDLRALNIASPDNESTLPPDAAIDESSLNTALNADLCGMLPGLLLPKVDLASMAHGLEVRAPFLDADFASFCISLPDRLKRDNHEGKWIMRRAYENQWPDSVRARGKQGFGSPVRQWMKDPGVLALKKQLLDDPAQPVFALVSFEGSRRLIDDDYKSWSLLCLAQWTQTWNARPV